MSIAREPALYEEMLDVLAESADAERLLSYRLSPERQAELDALLEKNRSGTLTAAEAAKLDEFERIEHLLRLLKARLRARQQS